MGGTPSWEKKQSEEPLHRNAHWYSFLFEMFLNSFGLILRLIRGIFSAL